METPRKTRTRGNGAGTAFKQGKTWTAQITYWEVDGETKKRKFKTKKGFKFKKDALAYIDVLQNAPLATSPSMTFNELYVLWSDEHYPKIAKDTENGYKAAYAKCTPLYLRKFNSLKANDLQKLIDEAKSLKGETLSRRSKADVKSLLNNIYKYALKNDYCIKNYAEFIVLPKKPKSKKDAFTPTEIQKFWNDYNNGNSFTGYILIMIYTGMRYGEISTIKKSNIHLSEKYMIGGIKTDAGIDREIPINDKIFPIIEKFYNANNTKLLEIYEKMFYTEFYSVLERLGIRKLSPHACRHTFFTLMANANIAPAVIMETGGHEEYQTTMGYTHIKLKEKIDAVNKL